MDMTAEELAQSGQDALFDARAALLVRFRASTDPTERQQIASSVDAINNLMDALDLSDLLSAATAVGQAADELEKVVGAARQQPLGQAFQGVVDALNRLEDIRSQAHAIDGLPKAVPPKKPKGGRTPPKDKPTPPLTPTPTPAPAPTPTPPSPALPPPVAGPLPAINPATDFAKLEDEYKAYYVSCQVRPQYQRNVDYYVQHIADKKATYADVVGALGVPWFFVGIIHGMESGFNFNTHLHNGDPLSARTVHVPAGRPSGSPPFSWRDSAIDALVFQGLDKVKDWGIPRMLYVLETYNGFGYRFQGLVSPYLWSFSNLYTKGKYVADNKFDPEAVSQQCGAGLILKSGKDSGVF
jgi:lysozyme family protein